MNRQERRAHQRGRLRPGAAHHVTRWDTDQPVLGLLIERNVKLHAGVVRGPGPAVPLCERTGSLFQHPIFARDPNFQPILATELRHAYALAALRLNDGCTECQRQLVAVGGDLEYPYLDPVKAERS